VRLATAFGVTLPFAAITIFLMRLVLLSHRSKSVTGTEGMLGEVGFSLSDISPEGKVQVHGEIWQAKSAQPVQAGERVKVTAIEGLTLTVTKI
jgi:membrane-bound serine protease (ClpP class)